MNILYMIISIISVLFLFISVLIISLVIYLCYIVDKLKKQYDEGLDVNLIAHRNEEFYDR
jgi:uncharacterized SAM-binding protein YcdF (DUF218 family)